MADAQRCALVAYFGDDLVASALFVTAPSRRCGKIDIAPAQSVSVATEVSRRYAACPQRRWVSRKGQRTREREVWMPVRSVHRPFHSVRRRVLDSFAVATAMGVLSSGCNWLDVEPASIVGMQLQVRSLPDVDVAYFDVAIRRKPCRGQSGDIESYGAIAKVMRGHARDPIETRYQLSDLFMDVDPGCYRVVVTPRQEDGALSENCAIVRQNELVVDDIETTSIAIVSRCLGDKEGLLGSATSINHPPRLQGLTISPSKFRNICEPSRLCATADDPDGDDIEFEWSTLDGEPLHPGFANQVLTRNGDGTATDCVDVSSNITEMRVINVRAFDLLLDENSQLTRVEHWFAAGGMPHPSRASISVPLHIVDGPVDETLPSLTTWSVRQGGIELGQVEAFSTGLGEKSHVQAAYGFDPDRGAMYRGHRLHPNDMPAPSIDESMLFFHHNLRSGELSLVTVHDATDDGSGGRVEQTFSGLGEQVSLAVSDNVTKSTVVSPAGYAQLKWSWDACCSDGAALTRINGKECIVVTSTFDARSPKSPGERISRWVVMGADREPIELAMDRPVELCPIQCVPQLSLCESDADSDSICDDVDQCEHTQKDELVGNDGCSAEQHCPCSGAWGNHDAYLACVAQLSISWFEEQRISAEQKAELQHEAIGSSCGDPVGTVE